MQFIVFTVILIAFDAYHSMRILKEKKNDQIKLLVVCVIFLHKSKKKRRNFQSIKLCKLCINTILIQHYDYCESGL